MSAAASAAIRDIREREEKTTQQQLQPSTNKLKRRPPDEAPQLQGTECVYATPLNTETLNKYNAGELEAWVHLNTS